MTIAEWIIIGSLVALILLVLLFRGRVETIKMGDNQITLAPNKSKDKEGPVLDPDAARLYTREAMRLTSLIGDLERRVMLSEMMKHGEEGLTIFCNLIRADFREFLYQDGFVPELMDKYSQENELVVNQIFREMHGWILLAMRQNSIPLDDENLSIYVKQKFMLWDGETDQIRNRLGKTREIHDKFLIYDRALDDRYFSVLFDMFKKAAKAEEDTAKRIECAVKQRQSLEDHFAVTAQVRLTDGCV